MLSGDLAWIEVVTILSIIVLSFSVGYWGYVWLVENPSGVVAQLVGGGTTIVGFLSFLGIIKLVDR